VVATLVYITSEVKSHRNMASRLWKGSRVIELLIHSTMSLEGGDVINRTHFNWQVKSNLWKYCSINSTVSRSYALLLHADVQIFTKFKISYSLFSQNPEKSNDICNTVRHVTCSTMTICSPPNQRVSWWLQLLPCPLLLFALYTHNSLSEGRLF